MGIRCLVVSPTSSLSFLLICAVPPNRRSTAHKTLSNVCTDKLEQGDRLPMTNVRRTLPSGAGAEVEFHT